jgi:hypothetical protein
MACATTTHDLAILGAGAAGMLAALRATSLGLRVVLFDPFWSQPNNLLLSGGLFPAAGSRPQAEAGVDDTPEAWLDDLRAFAGASWPPSCRRRACPCASWPTCPHPATALCVSIPSRPPRVRRCTPACARPWAGARGCSAMPM